MSEQYFNIDLNKEINAEDRAICRVNIFPKGQRSENSI